MTLLSLGTARWYIGHFFKRVLPDARERLGDPGKGIAAVIILAGLVLMVIGYRGASTGFLYAPPFWGQHLNNLLMLVAIILFGMGSSKGRMRAWLRHPMLTGALGWAVAHLLVRGDFASVLLFGGIAVWARAGDSAGASVSMTTAQPSGQTPNGCSAVATGAIRVGVIGGPSSSDGRSNSASAAARARVRSSVIACAPPP